MKKKKILLLAVLFATVFFAGGFLRQSGMLEKEGVDQAKSDLKNFTARQAEDYLYYHPDGPFNGTAKWIYKEMKGHEYYRETIYDWEWRIRNMKPPPNTGIPCTIKCV